MDIAIIGGLTKQLIKIHFNNSAREIIYSVPLKSIQNQFINLLQRLVNKTLFQLNPIDQKKHKRNTKGITIYTNKDLTKILNKALKKKQD